MLSMTGVSAGQASSYYTEKDNYHSKDIGEWHGKGAEALGLSGEIKKEDFQKNLLEGKDREGNVLVQNGATGEHRAGTDMTFSAPKSVSIAAELLGDTRLNDADRKAVERTLNYIENNFSQARITQNGVTSKMDTGNLVIARFEHHTSRALDPQLHTHCVIMNITQRPDGEWRAISNEALYQNQKLIGQVYTNELASGVKELGYSIQTDSKGNFEIAGIPKDLIDHFSQRSAQIDIRAEELKKEMPNANEAKIKEMACVDSREAKKDVDISTLKTQWEDRLQSLGHSIGSLKESIQKEGEKESQGEKMTGEEYVRLATDKIHDQHSTFSREELLKTAGKLSVGVHRIDTLEKSFNVLIKSSEVVALDRANRIYSTRDMIQTEKAILQGVQEGKNSISPIMTKDHAEKVVGEKYSHLTQGQAHAATHILSSPDRVIGIQGDAGTGKTTMLNAAREELQEKGYEVKGLSYTAKAVEEIKKNAGIPSQTLHSYLAKSDPSPDAKQVLIVDEASMMGSRQMEKLLNHAAQNDARVVLIGDTKQLQSINAGGIFGQLQKSGVMATVEMKEIVRQKDTEYKAIAGAMSEKNIDDAFQKLETQGRVSEISDRGERFEKVTTAFLENPKNTIVVTASNADRKELNTAIREELQEKNLIGSQNFNFTVREPRNLGPVEKCFAQNYSEGQGVFYSAKGGGWEGSITEVDHANHSISVQAPNGDQLKFDLKTEGHNLSSYSEKTIQLAEGDKVVFLKNDRAVEVQNGMTGTVRDIREDGKVSVQAVEKIVEFNLDNNAAGNKYSYIDHGYAVTDYKSQGMTAENVIYHADTSRETNFNQGYVAMTRGQVDLQIYTNDKDALKEALGNEQIKTTTLDFQIDKSGEGVRSEIATEKEGEKSEIATEKDDGKSEERREERSEIATEKESEKSEIATEKNERTEDRGEGRNEKSEEKGEDKSGGREVDGPEGGEGGGGSGSGEGGR